MNDKEAAILFALAALLFVAFTPWGATGNNILGIVGVITAASAALYLRFKP